VGNTRIVCGYELHEEVGKGAFGTVFRASRADTVAKEFAVKVGPRSWRARARECAYKLRACGAQELPIRNGLVALDGRLLGGDSEQALSDIQHEVCSSAGSDAVLSCAVGRR
jgi:hypothetical protein